ncbi:hypothetical protein SCAR479_03978 [Seiridium cardinale]|uniref:Uncharacterized protein n=1 Tax=Seiridium cardinale TaxID=138064 RepID=A0ABR2XZN5_9PEZI
MMPHRSRHIRVMLALASISGAIPFPTRDLDSTLDLGRIYSHETLDTHTSAPARHVDVNLSSNGVEARTVALDGHESVKRDARGHHTRSLAKDKKRWRDAGEKLDGGELSPHGADSTLRGRAAQ